MPINGLTDFRRYLRQLPDELAQEAGVIVQAQATEARAQIARAYPEGPTGKLRSGVTVEHQSNRAASASIVRSRARHASLFERGTTTRRTARGANRGAMPEGAENERMIPIIVRRRRAMTLALIELVRRAGFQVDAK